MEHQCDAMNICRDFSIIPHDSLNKWGVYKNSFPADLSVEVSEVYSRKRKQ